MSLHLSKCHIVENHMSRLKYNVPAASDEALHIFLKVQFNINTLVCRNKIPNGLNYSVLPNNTTSLSLRVVLQKVNGGKRKLQRRID